ncbi:MAG: hypothetical protein L0Y56_10255 [Nitrospira sp.]|nr:hypothetical protein [Nitrospira sp.]
MTQDEWDSIDEPLVKFFTGEDTCLWEDEGWSIQDLDKGDTGRSKDNVAVYGEQYRVLAPDGDYKDITVWKWSASEEPELPEPLVEYHCAPFLNEMEIG